MDVAVDPECWFVERRAGLLIGDSGKPDVPALVALANRFDGNEPWMLGREGLQDFGELGVAVETVKAKGWHRVF